MTPAALQTFRLSVLHSQYLETLPAGFGLELWQRSPESLWDPGRGWEGVPRGVILIIIIIVIIIIVVVLIVHIIIVVISSLQASTSILIISNNIITKLSLSPCPQGCNNVSLSSGSF